MKKYLVILTCMVFLRLYSQNKPLLYGVNDLPQSLLLNPGAEHTYDTFLGVPLLSGVYVSGGSSGVSVWDIFRREGDINTKIDAAIRGLDDKDIFTLNRQIEILSAGWSGRNKSTFYSAGIYQEADFAVYIPKDFVSLAYNGNEAYIDKPFEFSDISFAGELLSVYHFGVNKKVSKKLRIGGRAKVYMSAANINSTNNQGFFRTRRTPEGPNFFTHEVIGANLAVNTSGLSDLADNLLFGTNMGLGLDTREISGINPLSFGLSDGISNLLFSPNMGLGLDIGGTYDISSQLSLSASLLDIGFVSHSSDLNIFRAFGSHSLDGIELEFPDISNGQQVTDYWSQLVNGVTDAFSIGNVDDINAVLEKKYTTWRPLKFNGAINYSFDSGFKGGCDCTNPNRVEYKSQVGLHVNAIKRPRSILTAATFYYDTNWRSFFKTKISYTIDAFSKTNIGLLVSTIIKNFNFYLVGDNLLAYRDIAKTQLLSFQVGMQIVIN